MKTTSIADMRTNGNPQEETMVEVVMKNMTQSMKGFPTNRRKELVHTQKTATMTLTTDVQPLRDRLVEFFGILEFAPSRNPMSSYLLHDLSQLSEVVGTKETGVSEVASKMFLNPKTQSLISKLRTELEEGLRKHS